jgi:hypothetical protein
MMASATVLAWEFPNPISWAGDKIAGFVGDMASAGFEVIIGGLAAWVTDAVTWIVGGVFNYFIDAEDPNVQAAWFMNSDGPYGTTAAIGATLMVGFLLAGIAQGAIQGDVGGMLRRMAVDLPMSVLGIVGLITATQALIRLTDVLSTWVMSGFEDDISDFTAVVLSLSRLGGGVASALVVFLLGMVTVLAGLTLIAELAVRSALVYIVAALAPLVFAAQLWPVLKGTGQKLLRLLCGLIVAKLAMAVALAVAAAAAVGTGSGGEVTALPPPEIFAEDPGGSVTQAVGILLAAVAAFGIAAFMPFFVAKLLPLAEDAAVAQGLRSAPMRAVQQGMSLLYYSNTLPRLSSGWPGGSSGPSGRGPEGGGPSGGSRPGQAGGGGRGPRGPRAGGSGPAGQRRSTGGQGGGSGAGSRGRAVGKASAGSGAAAKRGAAPAGAAAGPAGAVAAIAATGATAAKRAGQRVVQAGAQSAAGAASVGQDQTGPARGRPNRGNDGSVRRGPTTVSRRRPPHSSGRGDG